MSPNRCPPCLRSLQKVGLPPLLRLHSHLLCNATLRLHRELKLGTKRRCLLEILARQRMDQSARSNEQMTVLNLIKSLFQLVDLDEMQLGFREC